MIEVKKIMKNRDWFLEKIRRAPSKVKEISKVPDADETKITREFFYEVPSSSTQILDYIAKEAEITKPTLEEKYQLFEEFNDGKDAQHIIKDEYDKFAKSVADMLTAIANN